MGGCVALAAAVGVVEAVAAGVTVIFVSTGDVAVGTAEAIAVAPGVSSFPAGVLVGNASGVAVEATSMVICKPQPVRENSAVRHNTSASARFLRFFMVVFLLSFPKNTCYAHSGTDLSLCFLYRMRYSIHELKNIPFDRGRREKGDFHMPTGYPILRKERDFSGAGNCPPRPRPPQKISNATRVWMSMASCSFGFVGAALHNGLFRTFFTILSQIVSLMRHLTFLLL